MNRVLRLAAIAAAGLLASTPVAWAQQLSVGQREYENNCAVCHGTTGKGDGPVSQSIIQTVPDLTQLSKANGGVFPVDRAYQVIDGRAEVAAHGRRDMPVWGYEYSAEASGGMAGYPYEGGDVQGFVRGRILALIEYISTLQEE